MHSQATALPGVQTDLPIGPDEESPVDSLLLVARYLKSRGLAAETQDAFELLSRLLQMPSKSGGRYVSVRLAARRLYTNRRTLGRWCAAAGMPSPSRILALGRVLFTVRAMRIRNWPAQRAAIATGWTDPFTFSHSMYRLTGLRPGVGRKRGLVALAEAWLQRELAAGRAEQRDPAPPLCPSCGQEVVA